MDQELRTRIWNNLVTSKFDYFYIVRLVERAQVWNKIVVGFLTVTSLTSVSLWVIWEKYPYVWAIIIAASQIISALKPVLGYDKRVKSLVEMSTKLNSIEIEFEQLFADYNTSKLDYDKASEIFFHLHKQSGKITQPNESIVIRRIPRLRTKAQTSLNSYLERNYSIKSKKT